MTSRKFAHRNSLDLIREMPKLSAPDPTDEPAPKPKEPPKKDTEVFIDDIEKACEEASQLAHAQQSARWWSMRNTYTPIAAYLSIFALLAGIAVLAVQYANFSYSPNRSGSGASAAHRTYSTHEDFQESWNDNQVGELDTGDSIEVTCSEPNIHTDSGREECEKECSLSACCSATGVFSCRDNNYNWCQSRLSICSVLKLTTFGALERKIQFAPFNIAELCSDENLRTFTGKTRCETACEPGDCCEDIVPENNCAEGNEEACDTYEICRDIQ